MSRDKGLVSKVHLENNGAFVSGQLWSSLPWRALPTVDYAYNTGETLGLEEYI